MNTPKPAENQTATPSASEAIQQYVEQTKSQQDPEQLKQQEEAIAQRIKEDAQYREACQLALASMGATDTYRADLLCRKLLYQSLEEVKTAAKEIRTHQQAIASLRDSWSEAGFDTLEKAKTALYEQGFILPEDKDNPEALKKGLEDYQAYQTQKKEQEAKFEEKLNDIRETSLEELNIDKTPTAKAQTEKFSDPKGSFTPEDLSKAFQQHQEDSAILASECHVLHKRYQDLSQEVDKAVRVDNYWQRIKKLAWRPSLTELKQKLAKAYKLYDEKLGILKVRKSEMDKNGKAIAEAGGRIVESKSTQRQENKTALSQRQEQIQESLYGYKKEGRDVQTYKQGLSDIQIRLQEQNEALQARKDKAAAKGEQLEARTGEYREASDMLAQAVVKIDQAIQKLPEGSPQRKMLEQKRKALIERRDRIRFGAAATSGNLRELAELQEQYIGFDDALKEKMRGADAQMTELDESQSAIAEIITKLSGDKEITETSLESLDENFEPYIAGLENMDEQLKSGTTELRKNNSQSIAYTVMLGHELNALQKVEHEPYLTNVKNFLGDTYKYTVGFVARKFKDGIEGIGKGLLAKPLYWLGERMGKVGFIPDILGGFMEGATDILSGIGTIVENPLQVGQGLGTLIGIDYDRGGMSLDVAKNAWKEMGKAIFAVEDFKNGEGDRALGKVAANVLSMLLPGSGAGAAGKTAYGVSRAANIGRFGSSLRAVGAGSLMVARRGATALKNIAYLPVTILRKGANVLRTIPKLPKLARQGGLGRKVARMRNADEAFHAFKNQMDEATCQRAFGKSLDEMLSAKPHELVMNPSNFKGAKITEIVKAQEQLNKLGRLKKLSARRSSAAGELRRVEIADDVVRIMDDAENIKIAQNRYGKSQITSPEGVIPTSTDDIQLLSQYEKPFNTTKASLEKMQSNLQKAKDFMEARKMAAKTLGERPPLSTVDVKLKQVNDVLKNFDEVAAQTKDAAKTAAKAGDETAQAASNTEKLSRFGRVKKVFTSPIKPSLSWVRGGFRMAGRGIAKPVRATWEYLKRQHRSGKTRQLEARFNQQSEKARILEDAFRENTSNLPLKQQLERAQKAAQKTKQKLGRFGETADDVTRPSLRERLRTGRESRANISAESQQYVDKMARDIKARNPGMGKYEALRQAEGNLKKITAAAKETARQAARSARPDSWIKRTGGSSRRGWEAMTSGFKAAYAKGKSIEIHPLQSLKKGGEWFKKKRNPDLAQTLDEVSASLDKLDDAAKRTAYQNALDKMNTVKNGRSIREVINHLELDDLQRMFQEKLKGMNISNAEKAKTLRGLSKDAQRAQAVIDRTTIPTRLADALKRAKVRGAEGFRNGLGRTKEYFGEIIKTPGTMEKLKFILSPLKPLKAPLAKGAMWVGSQTEAMWVGRLTELLTNPKTQVLADSIVDARYQYIVQGDKSYGDKALVLENSPADEGNAEQNERYVRRVEEMRKENPTNLRIIAEVAEKMSRNPEHSDADKTKLLRRMVMDDDFDFSKAEAYLETGIIPRQIRFHIVKKTNPSEQIAA